jgi:WD40 repeat protein
MALISPVEGNIMSVNLKTGAIKENYTHSMSNEEINLMKISKNQDLAVTSSKNEIYTWDLVNKVNKNRWEVRDYIRDLAINADASIAVIGSYSNNSILIDLKTGKPIHSFPLASRVEKVEISADSSYALSATEQKEVHLLDIAKRKRMHSWIFKKSINNVKISQDNKYVVISCIYDGVYVYDLQTKELVTKIDIGFRNINFIAISQSGNKIALSIMPSQILIWDLEKNKEHLNWSIPRNLLSFKPRSVVPISLGFINDQELSIIGNNGSAYFLQLP